MQNYVRFVWLVAMPSSGSSVEQWKEAPIPENAPLLNGFATYPLQHDAWACIDGKIFPFQTEQDGAGNCRDDCLIAFHKICNFRSLIGKK